MSDIYLYNDMDTLKVLLRKAAYRFRLRLMESPNQYVQLIMISVYFNCQSVNCGQKPCMHVKAHSDNKTVFF
jgi:hypothetical protein